MISTPILVSENLRSRGEFEGKKTGNVRLMPLSSLKIARLPAYNHVLELRKTMPGAILLDIGCCCAYKSHTYSEI